MSTDYYLFSPSGKKAVMVGSVGLGGVRSWPAEYGGRKFIAWAIDNNIKDVRLINEHELEAFKDGGEVENITSYDKSEDVFAVGIDADA
jgi:hypothetical protein